MSNKNYDEAIEAVIEDVSRDASKTVKKKIDILVDVCSSQIKAKSLDFTVARIAILFKEKGGVSEQSINNATGEKYKDIINAFQTYHGITGELAKKEKQNFHWIDKLDSSLARFEAMELIAENKRLRSQLQTQVEINREYAPIIDMRNKKVEPRVETNALSLTEHEFETFKSFFSEDNLKELGLIANDKGRLIGEDGRSRSKPGFVNIINKICNVKDTDFDIKGIS
jgi:hypothetical protein